MPDLSLLIKPCSGNCNINCKYCFYKALIGEQKASSNNFISEEIMEIAIKKALNFADKNLYIAFQGGEPTLIGINFYLKIHELINTNNLKGIKVHFAIQTNGLLINDEWCKLFKKYDYLVGLSLDGIEEVHNKYRVNYDNNGTFKDVVKTLKLLKSYKVKVNILSVVTNDLAKKPEEYFDNLLKLGVDYVQLIECLDSLKDGILSNDYSLDPKIYGDFLVKIFDLWKLHLGKPDYIHINYFEDLLRILLKQNPNDCGMYGYCSSQFILESNGDVFPCDFYCLPNYKIGNILNDNFKEMKRNKVARDFELFSTELDYSCGDCKYIKICRGGCRRARENKGYKGKTFLCEGLQFFFRERLNEAIKIAQEIHDGKLVI